MSRVENDLLLFPSKRFVFVVVLEDTALQIRADRL